MESKIIVADPKRIIEMASAFYKSCVLFTATDLGIFAKLDELGKAEADRLASALNLDQRGTRLLLDACTALELTKKEDSLYSNTPESAAFLVPGQAGDLSGAICYNRDVYTAWGRLKEFVRNGLPVERPEVHLGDNRDRTRSFVMSMHYRALGIGQAVIPLLDLAGCEQLLDVGGGPGTYSALMARRFPGLNCRVIDLPEVARIAGELIEEQGMADRVEAVPGNYRSAEFPADNDAVCFFGVLHQESPDSIRSLFAKANAALKPGGKIYVWYFL